MKDKQPYKKEEGKDEMHIVKLIRKKPKVKGVLKLETSRIKVKEKHHKSKKSILQAKSLVARGSKLLT